jgi:hypothetical protein
MRLPVPWLNYVYTRTCGARAREFYHHTLKRDANSTERLWHFWARKSASMLLLAVMAGGACTMPTAVVLLWVMDQFGPFGWEMYLPRAVWGALSVGFFMWFMVTPPHRPRLWD